MEGSTGHESAVPERRRTTQIQRVSLAFEGATLIALVTVIFWVGRQAQVLEELVSSRSRSEVKIETVNDKLTVLSGQVLQSSSVAAVAGLDARTKVLEARMDSGEQAARELRQELNIRFDRLERIVQASNR